MRRHGPFGDDGSQSMSEGGEAGRHLFSSPVSLFLDKKSYKSRSGFIGRFHRPTVNISSYMMDKRCRVCPLLVRPRIILLYSPPPPPTNTAVAILGNHQSIHDLGLGVL